MKLKKFRAENMAEAMQIIKKDIGSDAVIMSSRQVRKKKGLFGLFGKKEFEVVAGFEEDEETPTVFRPLRTESRTTEYSTPKIIAETQTTAPVSDIALEERVSELKGMIEQLSERMSATEGVSHKHFSRKVMTLCQLMIKNGVEASVAEDICRQTERIVESRNADEETVAASLIKDTLGKPAGIEPIKYKQKRVMLVGPAGVGKTTTLIKIAYMLVYQEKLNIGIINADSFRVAAKEHIEAYCNILKTDMITIYKPEELTDAMEAFADKDVVLIDTAGKVSDSKEYLLSIAKMVNIGKVDDIYITLSAATSERVLASTIDNYSFLKKYNIIVTKTDEIAQKGVFLYLAKISGRPLSYMTTGQNVPDDIQLISPSEITNAILVK